VAYFILVHRLSTFGDDRVLIVCGLSRFILAARAPQSLISRRGCSLFSKPKSIGDARAPMPFCTPAFPLVVHPIEKRTCRAQHNSRELSTDRRASLIFASRLDTSTFNFPHDSITFFRISFYYNPNFFSDLNCFQTAIQFKLEFRKRRKMKKVNAKKLHYTFFLIFTASYTILRGFL
jgi:hypothetical protein